MEEYLLYWWAGELSQHYSPFGLTMAQFNKSIRIGQYLFGLMGIFELIQFSVVMRKFHFVTVCYFILNRFPWLVINIPLTLIPKLVTGSIAIIQRNISLKDLILSIILPHVKATIKHSGKEIPDNSFAKKFQWLADHPLSETARRITVYTAFTLLSLAD